MDKRQGDYGVTSKGFKIPLAFALLVMSTVLTSVGINENHPAFFYGAIFTVILVGSGWYCSIRLFSGWEKSLLDNGEIVVNSGLSPGPPTTEPSFASTTVIQDDEEIPIAIATPIETLPSNQDDPVAIELA